MVENSPEVVAETLTDKEMPADQVFERDYEEIQYTSFSHFDVIYRQNLEIKTLPFLEKHNQSFLSAPKEFPLGVTKNVFNSVSSRSRSLIM